MVDAVEIEKRGTVAVASGLEGLMNSVGRAMARAQSFPDLAFAVVYSSEPQAAAAEAAHKKDVLRGWGQVLLPQVVRGIVG